MRRSLRKLPAGVPGRFAAVLLLGLAAALAGCAGPAGERGGPAGETRFAAVLEELRRTPENRAAGEIFCLASISSRDSDLVFRAFFSGLLATPDEQGARAFCASLIEGVITGEITETHISQFDKSNRSKEPLGTLLRKVLEIHLRQSSQMTLLPSPGRQNGGAAIPAPAS